MLKNTARSLGSFILISTLWVGSMVVLPVSIRAQEAPKPSGSKDGKTDKKAKKDAGTPTPAATQQASGSRTLSAKEDPSMIGKRNINGGGDKFFGWLGGSKEKEMQIG